MNLRTALLRARQKDILSPGERRALHNLLGDKTIIVKKADKGTTTVIKSREQKIKEGQILLNDLDNYSPLEKQMADETVENNKTTNNVYAHRKAH